MINLRTPGLIPERYEPVVVDHHAVCYHDGVQQIARHVDDVVHHFNNEMKKLGYQVYATSVLSDTHRQIAYLSNAKYAEAQEVFLRSDRNSLDIDPTRFRPGGTRELV